MVRSNERKKASVDDWLEDLATGTEVITKISWPSLALSLIVDRNSNYFCCSFTPFSKFPHHTNPIPSLSLENGNTFTQVMVQSQAQDASYCSSCRWLSYCSVLIHSSWTFRGRPISMFVTKASSNSPHIGSSPLNISGQSMMYISQHLSQSTVIYCGYFIINSPTNLTISSLRVRSMSASLTKPKSLGA